MPYVGEIRLFAGNFAPAGWMSCDGQLYSIAEFETLFQLIGTTYGGDGENTFAVPDLRGRVPIHQGSGPSGTTYVLGETAGVEEVTLTTQQIPTHNHLILASTAGGTSSNPQGKVVGSPPSVTLFHKENPSTPLAASMVQPVGGSQPHENRMPHLSLNYIISGFGVYPNQA